VLCGGKGDPIMSGGMFLIDNDGRLVEMNEEAYDSEDLLQGLLAQYPNLLAGVQVSTLDPRRWLLISRERGLPSEEGSGNRWSVDHLFLDQDAVPTIVEVKRSTDTRIRREVVGQMLDYAANAVVYWPVEAIRAEFEANQENPQLVMADFLSDADTDEEEFWQKAKTNLQAGKVRLVFVADEIPTELRRVIEFLNQQMDPAEVLALEIKQYIGGTLRTLVPRIVGQTVEAQQKKSGVPRESRQWNEPSFFEDLRARRGPDEAQVARDILEWAQTNLPRFTWGTGKQHGSFIPVLDHKGMSYYPVAIYTYGRVEIQFQHMIARPFDDESKRLALLRRLIEIEGVDIPAGKITKRPSIPLSALRSAAALKQFFQAFDWYVQEVKAS
jgi:hypothetical protein